MSIVASHDGLCFLPHVFHLADLTVRLGWNPRTSLRHLFIWKGRGYVSELGGHCGVYANLLLAQYPNWELALRMIMPTGVVIGIEVLRRAGWTTQIPYVPTVAVNSTLRVQEVSHFEIVTLPAEWFDLMKDGICDGENVALPHLAPAWALADLIRREGWSHCGLGPDDIYWDTITEHDHNDWLAACAVLGLGERPMNPDSANYS